jgi:transposase
VRKVVHRSPRLGGLPRSRWTLKLLLGAVLWLSSLSLSGAHRLLRRLDLTYRRGQQRLHSPDPDYLAKVQAIKKIRAEARCSGGKVVLLYLDEHTFYRRPSVACCYTVVGGPGAAAQQGCSRNTKRRLIGALDACTGRLLYFEGSRAGVVQLRRFYQQIQEAYPQAERIYVAQDNWSVHFLPQVTSSLVGSRVQLVRLPTYAPWTNPIEKVWRKLKQEVLHQHEFGDNWLGLRQAVTEWLRAAAADPKGLRRYTGLMRRRRRKKTHR